MRRADLAEAILSLTSPRERAATIVGDFLEEDLSALRFWFLVARTATAQAGRQLAAERAAALEGIVIRGLIAECGYLLKACVVYGCILVPVMMVEISSHSDMTDWWKESLQWLLLNLLVPFWLGTWMARRYRGCVASGTVALAFLHVVINLCAGFFLREAARSGLGTHFDIIVGLKLVWWDVADYGAVFHSAILYASLYPTMMLAGAAYFRLRQSRAVAAAPVSN